jgi:hypothetical protein
MIHQGRWIASRRGLSKPDAASPRHTDGVDVLEFLIGFLCCLSVLTLIIAFFSEPPKSGFTAELIEKTQVNILVHNQASTEYNISEENNDIREIQEVTKIALSTIPALPEAKNAIALYQHCAACKKFSFRKISSTGVSSDDSNLVI